MMSFKIPCGGFKLDEKSFSLDVNGVLSIPKPLTYDYMPEGYPSKDIEYVTMMEEQEVAFADKGGGTFRATSPVILDVKSGDKLTVVWDGVSYNVTVKAPETGGAFYSSCIWKSRLSRYRRYGGLSFCLHDVRL